MRPLQVPGASDQCGPEGGCEGVCPVCSWGFYSPCHTNNPGRPYRWKQGLSALPVQNSRSAMRWIPGDVISFFTYVTWLADLWILIYWRQPDLNDDGYPVKRSTNANACLHLSGGMGIFVSWLHGKATNKLLLSEICALGFFLACFFFFWIPWQVSDSTVEGQVLLQVGSLSIPERGSTDVATYLRHAAPIPLRYRWSVWSNWGVRKLVLRSKLALLIAWMCFLRPQCPSCQRLQELVAQEKFCVSNEEVGWPLKLLVARIPDSNQVLSGSLDLHHGIQFQYLCLELFVRRLREETSNKMLTNNLQATQKPVEFVDSPPKCLESMWNFVIVRGFSLSVLRGFVDACETYYINDEGCQLRPGKTKGRQLQQAAIVSTNWWPLLNDEKLPTDRAPLHTWQLTSIFCRRLLLYPSFFSSGYCGTYYCGRVLGVQAIPNSDGQRPEGTGDFKSVRPEGRKGWCWLLLVRPLWTHWWSTV